MKCLITMYTFWGFLLIDAQDFENSKTARRYGRIRLLIEQELEKRRFIQFEQGLVSSASDRNIIRNCLQTFN